MGLRFLLGRSGTNKSDWILQEIRKTLHKEKHGKPIFYIVPDQMTFQQEYKLFQGPEMTGSIRAQVVSFSRLAWRILQETGGSTRQFISSVGIQMMLKKIIEEKRDGWQIFEKAVEKIGFLPQLEQLMTEFKRHDITPEVLQLQQERINTFTHQTPKEMSLVSKLSDLTYIYEHLIAALADRYIDAEDRLDLLIQQIEKSEEIKGAEIYLDGFHRLTPKELRVVEALMKHCKQITVALTMDEPATGVVSELDLFYQPKDTYQKLTQMARENNFPIVEPVYLHVSEEDKIEHPHFVHMERYFDTRPSPAYQEKGPIDLAEAVHPRAEVEGAAQKILSLVRDKGYRFDDIVLFIREPETYHDLIRTLFRDYGIPVFIDEKRTMLNHPLIECIRSGLEMVYSHWRYDALFRVLKTGFIPATDEEHPLTLEAINELENYVLEYGIRTKDRWFEEDDWIYQRHFGFDDQAQTDEELMMQKKINAYRRQVVNVLQSFDEAIWSAETIREYCEAIYALLEEIEATKRLESIRNTFDEEGDNEQAREQEQVWDGIIQLFDELVEIAGDEEMSLDVFRATLDAGFETLEFAHVPPSIDHVIVGSIDRSRISGKKCAFLLGVNEGFWPLKPPADGLMNEQEREIMALHGIELAESSRRQLLDDWFYMYLAFTAVKEYMWVSYPLSDEEGDAKMPSQLIQRIQELFPENKMPILLQDPDENIDPDRFITTPEKTRSALTAKLSRSERGYPIEPIWHYVLNWYIENESKTSPIRRILQSVYYKNEPKKLSEQVVQKMYPKNKPIQTSVSRLEMFYGCSYRHFAQYSLNLEERKMYTLEAPDIGQLFHEALKVITEWVREEKSSFDQVTKEDAQDYARRSIEQLSPYLNHKILQSSNRYRYIQRKLREIIARATFILSEQARASEFSPVGVEVGFGLPGSELRPKEVQLPNGYSILLRGRIDRIDQAKINEELYLRIIDYKSSETHLNLLEVYYGLALQMLTYLDVVLAQSEEWLQAKATPAGVLYFHVHNQMVREDQLLSEEKIEEEIFKHHSMKGLLINNEQVVRKMDTTLDYGYSQIVPAAIGKSGNFYRNARVASPEVFNILREYMDELIKQAGILMTTGDVRLNPYEHRGRSACTFCPFDSVCQFDPTLENHNFRRLVDMKDDEILRKLQEKEEK